MEFVRELASWVVAWASTPYGPIALAVLAFAEASFFPIPPDTLLIPLALARPAFAFGLAALCTLGSVGGGLFGYALGYYGGRPLALRLFGEEKVDFAQRLYQRYDVWAIFVAAFTPIPYKVFTVAAGMCVINTRRFLVASLVGRGARFFLVAGAIYLFGETVQGFIENYFELAVTVFTVLLIGGFALLSAASRRLRRQIGEAGGDEARFGS